MAAIAASPNAPAATLSMAAHARHALARERGRAPGEYLPEVSGARSEVAEMYPYRAALVRHPYQHEQTARLADKRGQAGAGYAHVKNEDQQGRKKHVDHRTGDDSEHGIGGVALKAHLVVKAEGAAHERRAHEDERQVALGVGQYRRRRAEQQGQRAQEEQASDGNDKPCGNGAEEASRGHARGIVVALRAQLARYVVARALPEGEAYGLYYRHHGERYAHGGRGLRADAAHVEGRNDVVHARYEHAYDGRNGHRKNDVVNRRRRQESIIIPVVHLLLISFQQEKVLPYSFDLHGQQLRTTMQRY